MKNKNELFFPCLESPKRCFLTSVAGSTVASSSSPDNTMKNLSCDRHQSLQMSNNFQESEEWTLMPCNNTNGGSPSFAIRSVKFDVYLAAVSSSSPAQTTNVTVCKKTSNVMSNEQLWNIHVVDSTEHTGIIVKLCNNATGQYLAFNGKGPGLSGAALPTASAAVAEGLCWRLEFQTGELCFLSNAWANKRLKCDPTGNISLDNNWRGWEVWRFIDIGNSELLITSWTHHGFILASDWSGKVFTTKKRHGFGTRWRTMKGTSGNGVLLQSVETGRYLKVAATACTVDRPNEAGTEWQLEAGNRDVFYLLGRGTDKFLSCTRDGATKIASKPKGWEEWRLQKVDTGNGAEEEKYEIFNCHFQRSLGVDHRGYLVTNEIQNNKHNLNFLWTIELSEKGGFIIRSASSQYRRGRLCFDSRGNYWKISSEDHGNWEWEFHPKMPHTISGREIGTLVGVGVGALALTFAAPFAFTWGVAALGFGTEGIAAGSVAAGMMSAEAVASGGGVVAGGMVATLQSIGAAGLGAAGTAATMGSGALLGTVGFGVTAATVGGDESKNTTAQENDDSLDDSDAFVHLPLCAWRSW